MVCFPCTGPQDKGRNAGLSASLWWLLTWMCRHTRTIGDVENSSNPVAAEQAQCNVGLDTAWTMQCGAEVDIFTDIKPAALVALAALFHQANQLACSPDEYPIKVIITGGGNRLEETRSLVRNWLDDLYESGLMPEPSHFDPQDKVLAGPEWTDRAYPGRDIDPPRAWNPFDPQGTRGQAADPLGSMFETFGSLSLLTTQEAPAIVALRPIVEFTALWTESLRDRNPPAFQTTTQYEDQRRAPPFWLGDMETMTSDVLQAFSRSRIVMFQGARSFEFVGEFFATYIMDTRALSNARQAVSDLEEALVTLPRQVLLVDRESLLASYKPRHQGLFTALSQPSVYDQLRKIASAHLLDYVTRWNRFPLETKANATLDMIPIRSRDAYEDEFRLLQRNASTLTRRLVFGTVSPIDMVRWREDLLRMKDRIRGYFGPLLRNHRLAGQRA
ncbi:MAG: hypothetical protein M1838_004126 [Thelocarpon superellum]|nr:MAG: hypothetical protein M1838_004126 [Thelocarpon superellum]